MAGKRKQGASDGSQTPLGERVPSAGRCIEVSICKCVSNPSRGTCAFGRKARQAAAGNGRRSQTPLGERVPSATTRRNFGPAGRPVSNPSRGTCAFGPAARFREQWLAESVSNPSRGTCAFGQLPRASCPSIAAKSQTPLGERVPSASLSKRVGGRGSAAVSNPSRGTCAFGHISGPSQGVVTRLSQTPLGERVPSAAPHRTGRASRRSSLKPLSGNVCLRPNVSARPARRPCNVSNPSRGTCAFGHPRAVGDGRPRIVRLKPLSGNVCLRPDAVGRPRGSAAEGLKPLSGNVCLRPEPCVRPGNRLICVSNPSRGTCAFGLGGLPADDFRRESLKPLSGNVCLRPKIAQGWCCAIHQCLKPLSGNVCLRPWRRKTFWYQRRRLKPLSGNVCLRP